MAKETVISFEAEKNHADEQEEHEGISDKEARPIWGFMGIRSTAEIEENGCPRQ
jgi:hypothetical protein